MLKSFPPKKLVFKTGDPADFAYVIRSGTVEIFKIIDGKEVVLAEIKKGSIFGEMALITNDPRSASARTGNESTELYLIDQNRIDLMMKKLDPIMRSLVLFLIHRLRKSNESNSSGGGNKENFFNLVKLLTDGSGVSKNSIFQHADGILNLEKGVSRDFLDELIDDELVHYSSELDWISMEGEDDSDDQDEDDEDDY